MINLYNSILYKNVNTYTEKEASKLKALCKNYYKTLNKNALLIAKYLRGGISVNEIYNLTTADYELYLSNINEMVEEENKAINNSNK